MKRYFICVVVIIILTNILYAQTNIKIDSLIIKSKQQLSHAVNTWQEPELLSARGYFERLLHDQTYPWLVHYYIALADYRLVSFYFQKDKDKAKIYIDDGIEHLETCLEQKDDFAEAHSLLSATYGNKIGTNPFLGMTLGPKSGAEMSKAMELEPRNPRTYLISGWSAFFTPKLFGGGKDKAQKNFEQAIIYFDSVKVENPILPDWGHEEAYAWLGNLQMGKEEFDNAQQNFDKALVINPDFGFAKHLQYQLQNRISEKKEK